MSGTPFATRLAAVMVAVVLAALTLTVSLNYLKIRRVLRNQEDLVYLFTADDLAATVEDSMNLGISLAMLQTTQQLIQRRRATEGAVGISVFDATGTVLFDTDQFRIAAPLPSDWAPPVPNAPQWRAELTGSYLSGAVITNSFGQPAGGVVVRYNSAPLEARVRAVLLDMVRASIVTLIGTAIAAAIAAPLLTRQLRLWLGHASNQIANAATGVPDGGDGEMAQVVTSIVRTREELDAAEQALLNLGSADPEQGLAA